MAFSNNQSGSDEFFKSYVDLFKDDVIAWEKFATLMDTLTPTLERAKSLINILMEELKTSKEAKNKKLTVCVDNSSQFDLEIENPTETEHVRFDQDTPMDDPNADKDESIRIESVMSLMNDLTELSCKSGIYSERGPKGPDF